MPRSARCKRIESLVMNSPGSSGEMVLEKPLPGVLATLAFILMSGVFIVVFALDPRLGIGLLTLIVSVVLLLIRLESVVYAVVAVAVVFVDGWLMTRSPDDVPFRLGIGRLYLLEIPIYLLFLAYLYRQWARKRGTGLAGIFVSTPLD